MCLFGYLELTVFVDGEISWFEVLQKKYRKYNYMKQKESEIQVTV